MKNFLIGIGLCLAFIACDKEEDKTEPTVPTNNCGDKKICFEIGGTNYTSNVGMYHLDDTSYFAKFESNGQQLSIDWFSDSPKTGSFPATNVKAKGKSRIYWFPDASAIYWMSDSGEVKITKHDGRVVSATFNGRLQKLVNSVPNGEVLYVKNGIFTNGSYF